MTYIRRLFPCVSYILLCILLIPHNAFSIPPGTIINNTAQTTYDVGSQIGIVSMSNTVTTVTSGLRTPSTLELMQYDPLSSGAELVQVSITDYSTSGEDTGPFASLPPPTPVDSAVPIDLNNPVPLIPAIVYHQGEPVFVRLSDTDQNLDPLIAETVLISCVVDVTADVEILRLTETGTDSGVFAGYSQTGSNTPAANEGIIAVAENSKITVSYTDVVDQSDVSSVASLVDPFGIVFNSSTGNPVNGVGVTLINVDTGLPAVVLGDDGVSIFPSSITTGGTVTDSGGTIYNFTPGGYRFPFIAPGNYRLDVVPSARYVAPSTVATVILQSLPGAPFAIAEPGSRGGTFVVTPGPALHIDIPIDPIGNTLFITKTPNKDIVAIGDFLQYSLSIENLTEEIVADLVLQDITPLGFRYQNGSAKINGIPADDPVISSNGRTLTFKLGKFLSNSNMNVRYVVEVASGAILGDAFNHAFLMSAGEVISNLAKAKVKVREDLFSSKGIIIGSVLVENSDNINNDDLQFATDGGSIITDQEETNKEETEKKEDNNGIAGVIIYLEDGTYVVTDKHGMFHFENVEPGVHIVQLDTDSLPDEYEVVHDEKNSRFAGSAYSQFVDMQGGTMWRTDFYVGLKPEPKGKVSMLLNGELQEDTINYQVRLLGSVVPLFNLRLSIILPEGTNYESGSSMLNDKPLPDPDLIDNVLTYRFGNTQENWTQDLNLKAIIDTNGAEEELLSKALLTFDTHTIINQRTPLAENILKRVKKSETYKPLLKDEQQQNSVEVETTSLWADEKLKASKTVNDTSIAQPNYDNNWLEAAQPGVEWMWPGPDHYPPIPSIKIYIKHHPMDKLTLLLEGIEVSHLNFEDMLKNKAGTVAISRWRGVDLREGYNHFEVIIYDATGRENRRLQHTVHYSGPPVYAEIIKSQSKLISDGRNSPIIAIRLKDKDDFPAREGVIGEFSVDPPYAAQQEIESYQNQPLSGLDDKNAHYTVGKDGIALVKLQATSITGMALLKLKLVDGIQEIPVWLQPEYRDWIVVGVGEGKVGYNSLHGNKENLDASNIDDNFFGDERISFFAKGNIKNLWLLTMAYDTEKSRSKVGNRLFQTIDPDTFYTLYGDGTQQKYDAASTRELYLKIERDRFYGMFGDYNTGLTNTELSRYNRDFNGFKSELHAKNYEFNLFASKNSQAFLKDEIRGDGTSGLYSLSRKNIVENSEKVVIETRDRFRSEVILSSHILARHVDYNIDYETSTLFFKEPIYSKDEDHNPIFIVVDYEADDISDESYYYGGRGALKFMNKKLEIGTTYIHEGIIGAKGNLGGVDVTLDIYKNTRLKTEFATTRTELNENKRKGFAYLAELTHTSSKFDGKIYVREQDEDFGIGQQNSSEGGTRKLGLDTVYRFNQKLDVSGTAYRQYNLGSDAERDVSTVSLNFTGDQYSINAGLQHAEDRLSGSSTNSSNQIVAGASRRLLNDRLELKVRHEQSLGSDNDNADFPTRIILGADFALTKAVAVFANQELTFGEKEDTQGTRLGIKATPWTGGEIGSSIDRQYNEQGARVFANLGLKQSWKINEKWSVDAGLDRSLTVKNPGNLSFNTNVPPASGSNNDFTALSLGTTFQKKKLTWTSRVEFRHSDDEDKWGVTTGIYGEPTDRHGLSVSSQVLRNISSDGGNNTSSDVRLGMAYRPKNSKWTVLDRLDFITNWENSKEFDFNNWRIINNMNTNYKLNEKTQIALQYGAKYVRENIEGDHYNAYTDLIGTEVRYDLTRRWDIGMRGSILHSWNSKQSDYSTGVSIGYNIFKNVWISTGYNIMGFLDNDFSNGEFTAKGPYFQYRIKYDQETVKDALNFARWFNKKLSFRKDRLKSGSQSAKK